MLRIRGSRFQYPSLRSGITKLLVVLLLVIILVAVGLGVYSAMNQPSPEPSPTPSSSPMLTSTPMPTSTIIVTPTPKPSTTATPVQTETPAPTSSVSPGPTPTPNPTVVQEKIRDSVMYYLKSNHPETAQFMNNLVWTGGRVTPQNAIGAETYMYYSQGWNVTINYPVIPNPVYSVVADYSAIGISIPYRVVWKGTWQNEVINETNYVFAQ